MVVNGSSNIKMIWGGVSPLKNMKQWGGKREHSGKKVSAADEKLSTGIRLKRHLLEWLASVTDNKSEYINAALQRAKDQNFVLVKTEKFQPELEYISKKSTDWTFEVSKKKLTFRGTYAEAEASAIAVALKVNARVIELVDYVKD